MDREFWDAWLGVLIAMHEHGCATYQEFMGVVIEQWRDLCIERDHILMVSRALYGWGYQ